MGSMQKWIIVDNLASITECYLEIIEIEAKLVPRIGLEMSSVNIL